MTGLVLTCRGASLRGAVLRSFAGMAALIFMISPAPSAELFYMDHDAFTGKYVGPVGPLVLSGDIERGDYARLLQKIAESPQRFLSLDKLILASTAGDLDEAMHIAQLVKSMHTEVSVGPLTGRCAGACFLIVAAADQRGADGPHLLGMDGPPHAAAPAVRDFLRDNEVPDSLVNEMMRRVPGDVYWLSEQDEARLQPRSPSFARYLATKCAWDDALEHQTLSGQRPFADMQPLWTCRKRLIQEDARNALAAALKTGAPKAAAPQTTRPNGGHPAP